MAGAMLGGSGRGGGVAYEFCGGPYDGARIRIPDNRTTVYLSADNEDGSELYTELSPLQPRIEYRKLGERFYQYGEARLKHV